MTKCLNLQVLRHSLAAPNIQELDVIITPQLCSAVLNEWEILKTTYHNNKICLREAAKTCTYIERQDPDWQYRDNITLKLYKLLIKSLQQKGCEFYGNILSSLDFTPYIF